LAALFAAIQLRLSIILLETLIGPSAAGMFATANRFPEAARLIPNAFFGALFPALSVLAADESRLRRTFRRALLGLAAYGALAALALALVAPWLIVWVFGENFAPAVQPLQLLGVALLFSLLRGARTLYWYARRREAWVNLVNFAAILAQAVLSLWLIPLHGTSGAALALVIAEAAALAALLPGGPRRT
jgi:O-antigen/teichoic acid export membrane protein